MAGILISSLTYPPELTNKAWQKAKGLVGKMTPTGLGDALDKAEALYRKVDLQVLDPGANPVKSLEELDKRVEAAKAHFKSTLEPVMKEMTKVRSAADDAAAKLAKATGGGSAAKAAQAVSKAAALFAVTCKSLDLEAAVAQSRADIARKDELARKLLNDSLKKFITGSASFLKGEHTTANWGTLIKQNGRSVSNSVAQIKTLREKFWSDFEKFKGFDESTLKLSDKDPERMESLVKAALEQVKKIAAAKI